MDDVDAAESHGDIIDEEYPGTSVKRMIKIHKRVLSLSEDELNGDWLIVRQHILTAGGMKDSTTLPQWKGYTGQSFNDFNHCDLTAIRNDEVVWHLLDTGVQITSMAELGPGSSWSTCMIGCDETPPSVILKCIFETTFVFRK